MPPRRRPVPAARAARTSPCASHLPARPVLRCRRWRRCAPGTKSSACSRSPTAPRGAAASCSESPVKAAARARALSIAQPPTLQSGAGRAALTGVGARMCWWSWPTGCCCRRRCSRCRASAASTSTARCCRAGAAPRPSSARSSPATRTTGVTIMQMNEGLDTGPTLLAEPVVISRAHTAGSLHDELSVLGARLLHRGAHRPGTRHAQRGRTAAQTG